MQPSAGSQLRAARIGQRHSKTRSTRLLVVLCAAAAAGLSQMGGRGATQSEVRRRPRARRGRKGGRGGHLPPPPPGQARGGTGEDLRAFLRSLERQSYGAYQELRGTAWTLQRGVQLKIDQCQKDAFAPPSRCRVVFEGPQPNSLMKPTRRRSRASRLATGSRGGFLRRRDQLEMIRERRRAAGAARRAASCGSPSARSSCSNGRRASWT